MAQLGLASASRPLSILLARAPRPCLQQMHGRGAHATLRERTSTSPPPLLPNLHAGLPALGPVQSNPSALSASVAPNPRVMLERVIKHVGRGRLLNVQSHLNDIVYDRFGPFLGFCLLAVIPQPFRLKIFPGAKNRIGGQRRLQSFGRSISPGVICCRVIAETIRYRFDE